MACLPARGRCGIMAGGGAARSLGNRASASVDLGAWRSEFDDRVWPEPFQFESVARRGDLPPAAGGHSLCCCGQGGMIEVGGVHAFHSALDQAP